MDNKILFIIPVLLLIALVVYWQYSVSINDAQAAQQEALRTGVLNSLRQRMKFCEIKNDDIGSGTAKFWMICNGRPFYAEYDGEVKYEMNGWSFLMGTQYWDELKDCNFYSYDSLLSFYCMPSLDGATVKYFNFDETDFAMTKVTEGDLSEAVKSDIIAAYPFLGGCELDSFDGDAEGVTRRNDYLDIGFSCDGDIYEVKTNFVMMFPPGVFNQLDDGKIEEVFSQSFGVAPTVIDGIVSADFDFGELRVRYGSTLNDAPIQAFLSDGYEDVLREVGSKFLPKLNTISDIQLINQETFETATIKSDIMWFRLDESLVKITFIDGGWIFLEKIGEGFYE